MGSRADAEICRRLSRSNFPYLPTRGRQAGPRIRRGEGVGLDHSTRVMGGGGLSPTPSRLRRYRALALISALASRLIPSFHTQTARRIESYAAAARWALPNEAGRGSEFRSVECSDERARLLELLDLQVSLGEGPGREAFRTWRPVLISALPRPESRVADLAGARGSEAGARGSGLAAERRSVLMRAETDRI